MQQLVLVRLVHGSILLGPNIAKPEREMQMGYHVKRRRCNIGWLVHRLSYDHNMVLVERVGLVVVVECMSYGLGVGLDVVVELEHELDNKLLSQCYIPGCAVRSIG